MNVSVNCYRHEKNAPDFFRDLSFSLDKGKLHALHGKNGIGKSVFFGLLSKKVPHTAHFEGCIETEGKVVLLNQGFDRLVASHLTFSENLRVACLNRHPSFFKQLPFCQDYSNFLNIFHIDENIPVSCLSGGQKQILALLMILQKPASVLLLDEPTATLDEENAKLIFDFLQTLTLNGLTIFAICHDRELILKYASGDHFHLEKREDGLRQIKHQKLI